MNASNNTSRKGSENTQAEKQDNKSAGSEESESTRQKQEEAEQAKKKAEEEAAAKKEAEEAAQAAASLASANEGKYISKIPQVFAIPSKSAQMSKFNMSASEYLEHNKMSIYLQDAIKIILDRREEKPLDILNQYFETTLKGEHILLREYAFVNATNLNRKCFL